MQQPFISIILVSYNSEEYIKECLDSLAEQSYKNFSIFLIDNNSSDSSIQIVKKEYPNIEVIRNKENCGFAKACNIGIEYAFRSENLKYIVCLNIDTILDKNWLEELVLVAENYTNVGSVQSKILLHSKPNKINTAVNKLTFLGFGYCGNYLEDSSLKTEIEEIPYSSGTSILFSRSALEDVGFFDEDYFLYHEDVDLGLRLQIYGYKNFLAPKSICYHKYSFPKNNKIYFLERNRLITLLKNFSSRTLFLIFFPFVINEIGLFFYLLFEGILKQKLLSYFFIVKNIKKILYKRKIIQNKRKISDKEITKLFIGKIDFRELDIFFLKSLANLFFEIYWKIVKKLIK